MAVKIVISLDGVQDVTKGLNDVTKAGQQSAQAINSLNTTEVNAALQNLGLVSAQTSQGFRTLTFDAINLRNAKRALAPIVRELGGSLGTLGAFARTSSLGLGALVTVAGVAGAVALAKFSDSLEKTKKDLDAFQGAASGQTFETLKRSAQELGNTVGNLASPLQAAVRAFESLRNIVASSQFKDNPFTLGAASPLTGNVAQAQPAIRALVKLFEEAGLSASDAAKAAAEFFNALVKGGGITSDAVNKVRDLGEAVGQSLARALTNGDKNAAKLVQDLDKITDPVKRAQETFRLLDNLIKSQTKQVEPKAIENLTQGIDKFNSSLEEAAQTASSKGLSKLLGEFTAGAGQLIASTVKALGDLNTALDKLENKPINIEGRLNEPAIVSAAKTAYNELVRIFSQPVEPDLNLPESTVRRAYEEVVRFFSRPIEPDVRLNQPAIQSAYQALVALFSQPVPATVKLDEPAIVTAARSTYEAIRAIFAVQIDLTPWITSFQSFFTTLENLAQQAWNRISQIFQQQIQLNISGSVGDISGIPFASGGHVRGPGTDTSDSILARLSNFEYVIRAAAVRYYGPGFFDALNRMRLPKDFFKGFASGGLVLPKISVPKFNLGGLVVPSPAVTIKNMMAMPQIPIPTFASGGEVKISSGSHSLTLDLLMNGQRTGQTITIDDLERASVKRLSARIGPAPGWVRR